QSTRQCPDTVNVSVSFAPLPCQALVAAQTFPASGADVSCERAAAFAGFAESASPAGRPRLAQRLSVPARAKTAATARPVRVCLAWRCHHALAKGMAGVLRSHRCIRIVSSLRSLCGTGLVVVVIFFLFLVAVVVLLCVRRDHFGRRGSDERIELLLRLVQDRSELRIEVPENAVVSRAQRADIEGHAGVGIAVLALAQVGS